MANREAKKKFEEIIILVHEVFQMVREAASQPQAIIADVVCPEEGDH